MSDNTLTSLGWVRKYKKVSIGVLPGSESGMSVRDVRRQALEMTSGPKQSKPDETRAQGGHPAQEYSKHSDRGQNAGQEQFGDGQLEKGMEKEKERQGVGEKIHDCGPDAVKKQVAQMPGIEFGKEEKGRYTQTKDITTGPGKEVAPAISVGKANLGQKGHNNNNQLNKPSDKRKAFSPKTPYQRTTARPKTASNGAMIDSGVEEKKNPGDTDLVKGGRKRKSGTIGTEDPIESDSEKHLIEEDIAVKPKRQKRTTRTPVPATTNRPPAKPPIRKYVSRKSKGSIEEDPFDFTADEPELQKLKEKEKKNGIDGHNDIVEGSGGLPSRSNHRRRSPEPAVSASKGRTRPQKKQITEDIQDIVEPSKEKPPILVKPMERIASNAEQRRSALEQKASVLRDKPKPQLEKQAIKDKQVDTEARKEKPSSPAKPMDVVEDRLALNGKQCHATLERRASVLKEKPKPQSKRQSARDKQLVLGDKVEKPSAQVEPEDIVQEPNRLALENKQCPSALEHRTTAAKEAAVPQHAKQAVREKTLVVEAEKRKPSRSGALKLMDVFEEPENYALMGKHSGTAPEQMTPTREKAKLQPRQQTARAKKLLIEANKGKHSSPPKKQDVAEAENSTPSSPEELVDKIPPSPMTSSPYACPQDTNSPTRRTLRSSRTRKRVLAPPSPVLSPEGTSFEEYEGTDRTILLVANMVKKLKEKCQRKIKATSSSILQRTVDAVQQELKDMEAAISQNQDVTSELYKAKCGQLEEKLKAQSVKTKACYEAFTSNLEQQLAQYDSICEELETVKEDMQGTLSKQRAEHNDMVEEVRKKTEARLQLAESTLASIQKQAKKLKGVRAMLEEALQAALL